MNFTVTSEGRQFDRLGIMYLGDIEVFRTSTAEPTQDGIIWTYVKEMHHLDALWLEDQKIIFDLGNLINEQYTGVFHTKLSVTFFTVFGPSFIADSILPISLRVSHEDQPSAFRLPDQTAEVFHVLPKNVNRAVVSLAACGQAFEEFWYQNVLDSLVDRFADTTGSLGGGGSWREVQLLIDGRLAGVSWPFPIIFTGGVNPGFWRPIAGIDAFDLREEEIDITPWLPALLDGRSHSFEIRVASILDDGRGHAIPHDKPGSNWVVSGKIFLFLDDSTSVTTGQPPMFVAPAPQIAIASSVAQNADGTNETLTVTTLVSRQLSIVSKIKTASGARLASWSQNLTFENTNHLFGSGLKEHTTQRTAISSASSSGYAFAASYPLDVGEYQSPPNSTNFTIDASISRGLTLAVSGPSVFPDGLQAGQEARFQGSVIDTTQDARASYFTDHTNNVSRVFGTTTQDFFFRGIPASAGGEAVEIYSRHVKAVNGSVSENHEHYSG